MRYIPIHDNRITIAGAVSLEVTEAYTRPWRLQYKDRELYCPEMLRERASNAAGVRIDFRTDSRKVGLKFLPLDADYFDPARDTLVIDLEINRGKIRSVPFEHGSTEVCWHDLPDGVKEMDCLRELDHPL